MSESLGAPAPQRVTTRAKPTHHLQVPDGVPEDVLLDHHLVLVARLLGGQHLEQEKEQEEKEEGQEGRKRGVITPREAASLA